MTLSYEDDEVTKREFRQKLRWFEEEFDLIFTKTHSVTDGDIKLANQLLDKFSETINEFRHEKYLYSLTQTLTNIEKKYPEFF